MQIFVVDKNPVIAARSLCNVHIVKQTLESAQLLCTYLNEKGFQTPYRSIHKKHPCQLWLNKSLDNVYWLFNHFEGLLEEYRYRYNKIHACSAIQTIMLESFIEVQDCFYCGMGSYKIPTDFALVMPDEFKTNDFVESYRNYYVYKYFTLKRPMKWTGRPVPSWLYDKIERIRLKSPMTSEEFTGIINLEPIQPPTPQELLKGLL